MSEIRIPARVKLVVSFFSNSRKTLDEAEEKLISGFGDIDYKSTDIDFIETDYYANEMGNNLKTRIISFGRLQDRSHLVRIKIFCMKLEKEFLLRRGNESTRQVNIDPGFLSMENFILATGKGYSHRVYLDKGIWADLTLIYKDKNFNDLDWTYPNYKGEKIKKILMEIRKIYKDQYKLYHR